MNVDCLKIYRKDLETLVIEFIPDNYVKEQPINPEDYNKKLPMYSEIISKLNEYTIKNRINQVVVIVCDKCINIHKFNFVYFARAVTYLAKRYENTDLLKEVQVIHTNSMIKTVYNGLKRLIPDGILNLVNLY